MSESVEKIRVEVELDKTELERLVVVGGDLEFLISLPRDRLLNHTEVRICAAVLRRLIVDNQLNQTWRALDGFKVAPPSVEATDIDGPLANWDQSWVRYAWAGGATTNQAHHRGFIFAVIPKAVNDRYSSPDELFEARRLSGIAEIRAMTFDHWQRSTSVAIQVEKIGLIKVSRATVVKYLANRKGGVHFDPSRNVLQAGKRGRREVEMSLLDHGLLRVGHLNGPEFEIASMVQAIAGTWWAPEIVRLAHELASEDFNGDPHELQLWTGLQEADGSGWAAMRFDQPES
ncbi:hypothetical protein [Micromonospora tulbaghiae]|nr:hypothetical protein [Micromonospora tulbaghiae]